MEYKLTDHLGSTRMTYKLNFTCAAVYQNATIQYMADYYSFGKIVREYTNPGTSAEKYQYTGKERDTESGYDYFNARNYHSEVGRFLSVDALAGKMPTWSPYSFCFNNLLRFVDSDGKAPNDIIVLNAPKGATGVGGVYAGHNAVLIGNDKTGWTFVSKEGRDKSSKAPWFSNELTGGPALPPREVNFQTKAEYDVWQDKNAPEYTREVRFKTDEKTDAKALSAAKDAADDWYQVTQSSCAEVPSAALTAAGLDPGTETRTQGKSEIEYKTLSPLPNNRYERTVNNNKDKIIDIKVD